MRQQIESSLIQVMAWYWKTPLLKTNVDLLWMISLGTNLTEIWIKIQSFSLKKMHFNMSSAKHRPFCSGVKCFRAPMTTAMRAQYHAWSATRQCFVITSIDHWNKPQICYRLPGISYIASFMTGPHWWLCGLPIAGACFINFNPSMYK